MQKCRKISPLPRSLHTLHFMHSMHLFLPSPFDQVAASVIANSKESHPVFPAGLWPAGPIIMEVKEMFTVQTAGLLPCPDAHGAAAARVPCTVIGS